MTLHEIYQSFLDALKSPLTTVILAIIGIAEVYVGLVYGALYLSVTLLACVVLFLIWLLIAYKMQTRPTGHWEIQESSHKWLISSDSGAIATVDKQIKAKCLADDINTWDDFIYGSDTDLKDGEYKTPNGTIVLVSDQPDGKSILVRLNRTYNKNNEIVYRSTRVLNDAFIAETSWVSVYMNSKIVGPLEMEVVLPPTKKIEGEIFLEEDLGLAKRINPISNAIVNYDDGNGKLAKKIQYRNPKPKSGAKYVLRWTWAS